MATATSWRTTRESLPIWMPHIGRSRNGKVSSSRRWTTSMPGALWRLRPSGISGPAWGLRAGSIFSTTSVSNGPCSIRPPLSPTERSSALTTQWRSHAPTTIGAMMPSNGLSQPLGAKMYWPVYAEADRLGCCLAVHGGAHDRFGMDHMNMYVPVHALGHPWGLTINCADILYNGIFERFPRVRIAFLEGGIAWLLLMLERLHASHETHFQYIPEGEFGVREEQDPTKQIQNLIKEGRVYLGIETEELTLPFAIKTVGNKPFLYSSDFPHEVTNESCKHDLGELMESNEITEDDKAAMLWRNAETFYKLPL